MSGKGTNNSSFRLSYDDDDVNGDYDDKIEDWEDEWEGDDDFEDEYEDQDDLEGDWEEDDLNDGDWTEEDWN